MTFQFRPTKVEINLDYLRQNLRVVQSLIPQGSEIIGIIKANAYGHGSVFVARALAGCGIKKFAVATIEEGIELRDKGIRSDIMVLGGLLGSDLGLLKDNFLKPVIHCYSDLDLLIAQIKDRDQGVAVHLKFDTGMGRLGFLSDQVPDLIKKIKYIGGFQIESLMTHLAHADGADQTLSNQQKSNLSKIKDEFSQAGLVLNTHFANSASICDGLVDLPQWVRPGIMLYGSYPSERIKSKVKLMPVMTFKTALLDIKKYRAGSGISYGHTFVTQRDSVIGVLPVGYADGYSRQLSNKGYVYIKGQKAPVVGRVCMDLTMVDLTDISGAEVGDEVELWGENVSIDDLAPLAGTISYELLCGVSPRVPKIYLNL